MLKNQISIKLKFKKKSEKILKLYWKQIKNKVEPFDPAIKYGPNDAGISAITIIVGIVGLIAISWLFGKIYAQVAKVFENNNKSD